MKDSIKAHRYVNVMGKKKTCAVSICWNRLIRTVLTETNNIWFYEERWNIVPELRVFRLLSLYL